jgi:hypothetical protein
MATCSIAPGDKRALARAVGKHLTERYGKRTHYSPTLIKASMRKLRYPDVWDCWGLSLFADRADFDAYHAAIGEACDYGSMNAEMLSVVDSGSVFDFLSADWTLGDFLPDSDLGSTDMHGH